MRVRHRLLSFVLGSLFSAGAAHAQTSDTILADGFESGDTSAWSATSPGGFSVGASGALAQTGHGLRLTPGRWHAIYLEDATPSAEKRYRARFYFRIDGIKPPVFGYHPTPTVPQAPPPRLFEAYTGFGSAMTQIQLLLGRDKGLNLSARIRLDTGKTVTTPPVFFAAGAHFVEFDWRAASSATAKDGSFKMWLDNNRVATLTGLANGAAQVDRIRFGLLGLCPWLTGLSLDQFSSRKTTFIGPDFSAGGLAIGEWSDAPGSCPTGMNRVDLSTVDDLRAASRGEDAPFSLDPPGTCYFIHNGTYLQQNRNLLLYILKGGTPTTPRYFVGESREGVILRGRVTTGDTDNPGSHISNIVLANMTFDLTGGLPGYGSTDAFNTLTLNGNSSHVLVDHVTFTGDCDTGLNGAHIETERNFDGLVVESSLIENFGHCNSPGDIGHQDHGIYLAAGKNITIQNNVIRGNSSRGIQFYTGSDIGDSLTNVTVQQNRIYQNGHDDFEDGIVINGPSGFPISNVLIFRNLIYKNFYSGIRWAGPATSGIVVQNNTFDHNGNGSGSSARSEINIDDAGEAVNTEIPLNIFATGNALINDCFDASSHAFSIGDNVVQPSVPSGGCVVGPISSANPQFVNANAADYRTQNPAVAAYGAYAP